MSGKSERAAAREAVAAYHEASLAELLTHVAEAIDDFRGGRIDAFEVDQALFQYSRAARELWKFCNATDVEWTAEFARERPPTDWWERGAFKKR